MVLNRFAAVGIAGLVSLTPNNRRRPNLPVARRSSQS
jgi:hypothetical protein